MKKLLSIMLLLASFNFYGQLNKEEQRRVKKLRKKQILVVDNDVVLST